MTSLTLKQTLTNIALIAAVCGIAYSICSTHELVYQQKVKQQEVHPLCKDTPTKTAWVAYRDGVPRCFLENNMYPHRATGSNIDVTGSN
jgi:hypothetical protein